MKKHEKLNEEVDEGQERIRFFHPEENLSIDLTVTKPKDGNGNELKGKQKDDFLETINPFTRPSRPVTAQEMRVIEVKIRPKKVVL